MSRGLKVVVVWMGVLACLSCQSAQNSSPADWPPSPFSLPASTVPQSAWYSRDAGRALELHAATTNVAAKQLLADIRDMKQKLAAVEADAWQKDPMLLTCDRFIEKTHDWVMAKHHPEMEAEAKFLYSTNPVVAGQLRKLENDLSHLINLMLLKELGDNTNFTPLIQSTFDNLDLIRKGNTNSVAQPELQSFPYWQCDRMIGYRQTNAPSLTNAFAVIRLEFVICLRCDELCWIR